MEIHNWVLMTVIMVVVVVLIIYVAKIILLQKQLQHEETMKKLDFMQKKEWEQFLFERQDELAEKKKTEERIEYYFTGFLLKKNRKLCQFLITACHASVFMV